MGAYDRTHSVTIRQKLSPTFYGKGRIRTIEQLAIETQERLDKYGDTLVDSCKLKKIVPLLKCKVEVVNTLKNSTHIRVLR